MKKTECVLLLGIVAISLLLPASNGILREANASPTSYDYVIITTNDIVAHSARLEGFIRLKERFGYSVKVVTETDFDGLDGQAPNGRAEKIRQWLINNYTSQEIEQGSYVLLIGNPDPAIDDIPMKMCWIKFAEPGNEAYPTDFFYADLTGNWDLDGDLYFGEHTRIDNPVKPSSLSDGDTFSINWTGQIDAECNEAYSFLTFTDDGVKLWIDGDLIINDWTMHPPKINEASKSLSVGKHTIKLKYFENTGDAIARLYWKSEHQTGGSWSIIPKERLFHDGSAGGLTGEYYDNINFTDLESTQVDETVDFVWLTGDYGPGGVDFKAEVYVGRIPVYDDDYAQLDEILQKMIDYETVVGAEDLSWRKKILLPTHPSDEVTYGWELQEKIKADIAVPKGFAYYRIYSPGIDSPPTPPPTCEKTPCTEQNVEDEWKNGYGMVTWFTHGGATGANNVFSTARCPNLDDTKPSFTFQASCSNAEPETKTNLAYSLLKHGAVSTVGATRMSGYGIGWTNPSPKWGQNQDLAYYYTMNIILDEDPAGKALYQTKDLNVDEANWGNQVDYNLYGDPSCSLFETIVNDPPVADANGPYVTSLGSSVLLNASGSYDPDGDGIIKYEWDVDNDGTYDISTNSPTYLYTWTGEPLPGTVTLQVTDLLGATDTDTTTITTFGVEISLTPATISVKPGQSALYTIEVHNLGNVNDTFNITLVFDDFGTTYRAFPTAILSAWTTLDDPTMTLNPFSSDTTTLTITVPHNWAGMDNATYEFNATATSVPHPSAKDTGSAALQVQATKHSMAEYIKLEIQWLKETVNSLNIKEGIRSSLLAKLADAEMKVDRAIQWIVQGRETAANNMLNAAENMLQGFVNEVQSQAGKAISPADAETLIKTAQKIQEDIQKAKSTPLSN
jgi:hypothetical protein